MALHKIDKLSLEYLIKSIDNTLPNIQDNSVYNYLLDVRQLLVDLLKGRST
jgi:hypothetical protein